MQNNSFITSPFMSGARTVKELREIFNKTFSTPHARQVVPRVIKEKEPPIFIKVNMISIDFTVTRLHAFTGARELLLLDDCAACYADFKLVRCE